jgi:hypothetical protein
MLSRNKTVYLQYSCFLRKPVLPTNVKNSLLDQPKNSAAGEKVRPPHKIDSQRPILQFFQSFMIQNCKEKLIKPVYRPNFWQEI